MPIITADQAAAIMADEDAEHIPLRVLNEAGQRAVTQWLRKTCRAADHRSFGPWFAQAEQAAADAQPGEDIIIEAKARETINGQPATLKLDPAHFDWQVGE